MLPMLNSKKERLLDKELKMEDKQLKKLTVCIENEEMEDIVIIFADPSIEDLKAMIRDECVVNAVNNILFLKKEETEEKIVIPQEVFFLDCNKVEGIIKEEEILEDIINDGEGDIQDNVKGEIDWNNDEGSRNLENGELDNLHKEDISIDNLEKDFPADDDSGNYNDVGRSDISYVDNLKDEETIEKIGDQPHKKIFLEPRTNKNQISGLSRNLVKISTKDEVVFKVRDMYSSETSENKFSLEENLTYHKKTQLGEKHYTCSLCEKSFSRKSFLTRHENFCLKNSLKEIQPSKYPFPCDLCGQKFTTLPSVKRHKICVHKEDPNELSKSTKEIPPGPFACDICGKKIVTIKNLKRHKKYLHFKEKLFVECDICKQKYSHPDTLKNHMKFMHGANGERLFSCRFCKTTFTNNTDLNNHRKIHKDDPKFKKNRPYSCDICGKTFISKGNFTIHQRSHTGEKPYVCDVCGKSYCMKMGLEKHQVSHTGIKAFECKLCNIKFSHRATLRRHEERHQSDRPTFQCTICKKEFSRNTSLRNHMKHHEDIKPVKP